MKLSEVKPNDTLKLEFIPKEIKAELIRLGLCIGDSVCCIAKIPQGPVVLLKGLQEIAIGFNYAKQIIVQRTLGPTPLPQNKACEYRGTGVYTDINEDSEI